MKPLVTIMIPTYNQSQYIKTAIDSALAQTYKNLEIIISDDSIDNLTQKIVSQYTDKRIRYYKHTPSLGRVKNYRFLLSQAKGEWVINLDGDDFFIKNDFIEIFVNSIKKDKNIGLIFSKQLRCQKEQNFYTTSNSNKIFFYDGKKLFLDTVFKNIELPHLCCMYKKELGLKYNFYNYDILSSDRESILRILLNYNAIFIDLYCGCWRIHNKNISQSYNVLDLIENLKMYDRLFNFAKGKINIFLLFVWKLLGKYKMIFVYLKENNGNRVKLLKYYPLLIMISVIDIRLYKK